MREYAKTIFSIGLITVLLILGMLVMRRALQRAAVQSQPNPYPYSLDELTEVQPGLVLYRELTPIILPLQRLHAMTVAGDDQIYVAGDERLLILNRDAAIVKDWELPLSATALTVDADGNVYVGLAERILVYDGNGVLLREITGLQDSLVTSLAVYDDLLFVADARRKAVLVYDDSGTLQRTIDGNTEPGKKNHFVIPSPHFDIALAGPESLWIVNPGRHTLENYSFTGELRTSWQRQSMRLEDFCGCCNPIHIARLSNGSFITAEKGIIRVKEYTQRGDFTGVVALPDQFQPGTVVQDLAVDGDDRVYVLDPKNRTVRIFERTTLT